MQKKKKVLSFNIGEWYWIGCSRALHKNSTVRWRRRWKQVKKINKKSCGNSEQLQTTMLAPNRNRHLAAKQTKTTWEHIKGNFSQSTTVCRANHDLDSRGTAWLTSARVALQFDEDERRSGDNGCVSQKPRYCRCERPVGSRLSDSWILNQRFNPQKFGWKWPNGGHHTERRSHRYTDSQFGKKCLFLTQVILGFLHNSMTMYWLKA